MQFIPVGSVSCLQGSTLLVLYMRCIFASILGRDLEEEVSLPTGTEHPIDSLYQPVNCDIPVKLHPPFVEYVTNSVIATGSVNSKLIISLILSLISNPRIDISTLPQFEGEKFHMGCRYYNWNSHRQTASQLSILAQALFLKLSTSHL